MEADIKSSGFAALAASPLQMDELGTQLFPEPPAQVKDGANAFMGMLTRAYEISERTVLRYGNDVDGRDYKSMAFEIETAILANLLGSGKEVREGFLRAMTDYIASALDGCPCDLADCGESSLTVTAAAYNNFAGMGVQHDQ
jgi:hypothetical protein